MVSKPEKVVKTTQPMPTVPTTRANTRDIARKVQ